MRQKMIQFLLILGILFIPILFILKESTDLSVRYIAIIFSVLSSLFSIFISFTLFKFVYKIFIQFSEKILAEVQSLFLGYIFLNSLVLFALKDAAFLNIFNVLNPILFVFLILVTISYATIYEKNKLLYAAAVFYTLNVIFALIGVMMNHA